MDRVLEKKMRRNIQLFGVYKVFTKRVFLPLTTIYASQVAGLSVFEIGVTTASASIVSILFETTTGFWADKHGHRKSAQIGAILACIATLLYVAAPYFAGILAASIVIAIGYSFISGSIEALMHDSLVVLKQTDNYAKIASRAQSLSLVVNAAIVATVPLLYPIDPRLPFVVGATAYGVLFLLASALTEPPIVRDIEKAEQRFVTTLRSIITKNTVWFFAVAGLAIAFATSPVDIYNLSYVQLGLDPKYLGFLFAAGSLAGAAVGFIVHRLRHLSFRQYASFDLVMNVMMMVSIGILQSLPVVIVAFVINMALWRYQSIMYQHYILRAYGNSNAKATLLSLMNNFRLLHDVWLTLVFAGIAHQIGVLSAAAQGIWMIALLWPILMWSIGKFEKSNEQ